ncbi:HAD family hydrolase [Haloprofundus marisrubri]|uniref:HAD family hydrolase n=1 Tax=Haloprofundus marisrubri TaxID=1514971 RepID=UPI0009E3B115|nr:HAD family hydrolase [Haloprofundus marisrubri]
MTYDTILFDVDGVILRWPEGHPTVYRPGVKSAFDEFDASPSTEELNTFLTGSLEEMVAVCEAYDVSMESFWPRREFHVSKIQQEMMDDGERTLYDDTAVLSDLWSAHSLGLVSNNQHDTVTYMVETFSLGDLFDTVYGREPSVDGFRRTKPHPCYLERAIGDVGVDNGLYVGDSACDVEVAHALGLDSVFLRRPHRVGYELSMQPTYEVETLSALSSLSGVVTSE